MLTFKKTYTFTIIMENKDSILYAQLLQAKSENRKLLAVLLDPDKIVWGSLDHLILKINQSPATHIFIGGSLVKNNILDDLIVKIRQDCDLPIVLFPGNPSQISNKADAILFLSLISGRNPDFLLNTKYKRRPFLKRHNSKSFPQAMFW